MLKQYALKLPGKVFCGENALEKIKDILAAEGAQHVSPPARRSRCWPVHNASKYFLRASISWKNPRAFIIS